MAEHRIERVARRMGLWDRRAGQSPAPIVFVALHAGEIELALPPLEDVAACVDERSRLRIIRNRERLAPRLARDIGGQTQQLLALERQRRRLLPLESKELL